MRCPHVSLILLHGAEDTTTRLLVRHSSECVEAFPGADEHLLEDQRTVPRVLLGDLVKVPEGISQRIEQLFPTVSLVACQHRGAQTGRATQNLLRNSLQ